MCRVVDERCYKMLHGVRPKAAGTRPRHSSPETRSHVGAAWCPRGHHLGAPRTRRVRHTHHEARGAHDRSALQGRPEGALACPAASRLHIPSQPVTARPGVSTTHIPETLLPAPSDAPAPADRGRARPPSAPPCPRHRPAPPPSPPGWRRVRAHTSALAARGRRPRPDRCRGAHVLMQRWRPGRARATRERASAHGCSRRRARKTCSRVATA